MLYFVKDSHVHKFPVPPQCRARYNEEQLRDTVPHGVSPCLYCMHRWPKEEGGHVIER